MRVCTVLLLLCVLSLSCTRVQVADAFKGTVVDADSGTPLPGAAVRVTVMRMSSFDGSSQFQNYLYTTDTNGVFLLPARKQIVESIPNRVEQMRYYEVIQFSHPGYVPREFSTETDDGLFSETANRESIVVKLKKSAPPPSP